MIIKKLQINGFGNIEDKEIELKEGLNVIYGTNESGKSTLANFIKAIFYGINKNKAGNEFSEYEYRKPWKGAEFSGKIEYEWKDKKYTVYRDFHNNSCKVYDENGSDISSEFTKDKARGIEVGAEHLGIDEETFMNTLYVGQDQSTVDMSSQKSLIQKLTNILQSGQESISFEKIKAKLQKKVLDEIGTERTHNKPMNLIKRELMEKEQTRQRLLNNRNKKEVLEERKNQLMIQLEKTEQSIDQAKKVLEIKEKYASLLEEKERTYELTIKMKEKEKQEKIANNKKQFRNGIILIAVISILAIALLNYFGYYWWAIAELLLTVIGVVVLKLTNRLKLPEEEEFDFNVTKEELNKKELKELEKLQQQGMKSTYIDKKVYELKTLLTGLEKNKNDIVLENHKIKIEEDSLKESIERLNETEEQLDNLKNKKQELLTKSKVIHLSLEKLEEAYDELKKEVIPELQKNIQSKIEQTTGGAYKDVIYNNEEGIVVENSVGEYVTVSKLSVGTIDQMYLGFRLGISEKMGDIPIVLDESFAYYDNERLQQFLKSFQHTHQQIIILTCSHREKEILDELKLSYHYLEI